MKLLYGKPVAEKILSRLKSDISTCEKKPGLAVISVGKNLASEIYVNLKEKKAQEIGMDFFRFDLAEDISESEVITCINNLNDDSKVHGIIVQLPLPEFFNTKKIIDSISSKKDVDGFHPENTKLLLKGNPVIKPVFPSAIISMIKSGEDDIQAKSALILANSDEFGEIMRMMLERENIEASYVLAGNIPSNLGKIKGADIVVSAMGSPGLLKGEMFKSGAIVIDGGIDKIGEKVFGDVDFSSTEGKDGFLTPVPGGVGPVTIACLLENVYLAFEAQQKEKKN